MLSNKSVCVCVFGLELTGSPGRPLGPTSPSSPWHTGNYINGNKVAAVRDKWVEKKDDGRRGENEKKSKE